MKAGAGQPRLWRSGSRRSRARKAQRCFRWCFWSMTGSATDGTFVERRRRLLTIHAPLVGFALLAGIVRLIIFARIEYPGQVSLHWSYVLLELDVIRRYVWMLIVPSGQALFHEVAPVGILHPRALLAVIVVGSIVAVSWTLRRVDWTVGVGLLWFLLVLVPSSALIALDQGEPMAEHRIYLASCGIFLAIGAGVQRIGEHAEPRGWSRPNRMAGCGRAGARAAVVRCRHAGQERCMA